jgi:hypothetical protein
MALLLTFNETSTCRLLARPVLNFGNFGDGCGLFGDWR